MVSNTTKEVVMNVVICGTPTRCTEAACPSPFYSADGSPEGASFAARLAALAYPSTSLRKTASSRLSGPPPPRCRRAGYAH